MSLLARINGSQNLCLPVFLADSSSTTGAGKTGLTGSSSGLIIAVRAEGEAAPTVYSASGATIDSITTIGTYVAPAANHCRFKEVDATNEPGTYELQLANTRFAVVGATWLKVTIQAVASNVPPHQFLYDLRQQVDVRLFGGQAGLFTNGLPSVDIDSINQQTTTADALSNELVMRVKGTVSSTGFTPTATVFECSDITDVSTSPVYQYAGVLFLSGANIRRRSVVLNDVVGTAGRRITIAGVPVAPANGDTILLL